MSGTDDPMLVDEAALRSQTFADPALLNEIVALFALQAPELIAGMEAAEGAARAEIAHRLKGSALALGATALAQAAGRLEQGPGERALLQEVRRLADETIARLQAIVRQAS